MEKESKMRNYLTKNNVKVVKLILVIILMININLLNSRESFSEDRLVIQNAQNQTKLVITDEGRIGINTLSPMGEVDLGGGQMSVNGGDTDGDVSPRLVWQHEGRMDMGYNSLVLGGNGGANMEFYSKWHSTRPGEVAFVYGGGNFGKVSFYYYNGSDWIPQMTIQTTGRLDMGGGAYCTGTTWVDASSREYKENIKELTGEDALSAFEGLKPVKFKYKNDLSKEYVGFIAEDVPDLVATKDKKGLSPMDIVAVLTKVVQEQQEKIDQITKKLEKLESSSKK